MFLLFKVYNFPYEDRINLEPTVSQPNFHSPPPDYPPPPPVLGPKPNLTKISSPRKIFSRDDVIRQTSPPAFLHQNLGSKASSLPPKPIKKPPRAPPPIPSKPSTMPDLVPNLPPLQVNLAPQKVRGLWRGTSFGLFSEKCQCEADEHWRLWIFIAWSYWDSNTVARGWSKELNFRH